MQLVISEFTMTSFSAAGAATPSVTPASSVKDVQTAVSMEEGGLDDTKNMQVTIHQYYPIE